MVGVNDLRICLTRFYYGFPPLKRDTFFGRFACRNLHPLAKIYTYNEEHQVMNRRTRNKAGVHVPDFNTLVPALELSLPIQLCRHISKGVYVLHPRATALRRERESQNPVRERQLCSGNVSFVTWRSSSYIFPCVNITLVYFC